MKKHNEFQNPPVPSFPPPEDQAYTRMTEYRSSVGSIGTVVAETPTWFRVLNWQINNKFKTIIESDCLHHHPDYDPSYEKVLEESRESSEMKTKPTMNVSAR